MLPTTRRISGVARQNLASRGSLLEKPPVDQASPYADVGSVRRQSLSALPSDAPLIARSVPSAPRAFHTSAPTSYYSTSYNATDVPEFFVKYKARSAASLTDPQAPHEELGLMHTLTHSIRTGDVVATTRRLRAKVPIEHHIAEGHVVHSSGFVVPGPGHTSTSDVARAKEKERNERVDLAIQTAAVAHRVLESDFDQVNATTLPTTHKIPFEVREPDGTVKHPSGFVPPTPAHKFRHFVKTSAVWDRKVSVPRQVPRQPSPAHAVLRAMHTNAAEVS